MKRSLLLKEFLDEARRVPEAESRFAAIHLAGRDPGVLIDTSYYQPVWSAARLRAIGGIGNISKASMGGGYDAQCDASVAQTREAGLLLGLYHWLDPTASITRQLNLFCAKIDLHNPEMIWVDIEQCWSNWARFWDYIYKRCSWANVPKYTDNQITNFASAFMSQLKARYPSKYIGVYTGKWFVDAYAPSLSSILSQYRLWLAAYITSYSGPADLERFMAVIDDAGTRSPILPRGCSSWDVWQITSGIKVEGLIGGNGPVDLNVTRLNKAEFVDECANGVVPPVVPPTTWTVKTTGWRVLFIRNGPGTIYTKVGALPYESIVEVCENQNGWLRLADGRGWISAKYTRLV